VRQNYLWDRLDSSWTRWADGSLEFSSPCAATSSQHATREGQLA
jgi:hypothetical protein